MASGNPFHLLGDDDNDDPSLLIAAQQLKAAVKKPAAAAPLKEAPKLPSKPLPPAQAVREAKSGGGPARDGGSVGGGRGSQGRGRGGRGGGNVDYGNESAGGFSRGYGFGGGAEDVETRVPFERERGANGGPHQPYRGGRRGGFGNGEAGRDGEQMGRRVYERRSGTGRGNELKREGSGRGNWGTVNDDVIALENANVKELEDKIAISEKPHDQERRISMSGQDNKDAEAKEEKEEDKDMTLEEYEKIREDRRKALLGMKAEERKVDVDKEFGSMKLLSKKEDDIFVKLGSSKDLRKTKDNADKDDKVKKPVRSINEFLKPAEGGRYRGSSGRGRGRGRGGGEGFQLPNDAGSQSTPEPAIKIEDPGQFPTLGVK